MATPTSSLGVIISREDPASPGTYNPIGSVGDVSGPDFGSDTVETTAHDAAARRRTYIATLGKSTQVGFPVFLDSADAQHGANATTGLVGDGIAGSLRNFRITYPDNGAMKIGFSAIVNQAEVAAPVEGAMMMNVALQVSGAFTFDGF